MERKASHIVVSNNYQPLSVQRLHEGVVQQIVAQIVNGTLAPGVFLPSETVLAQQFGVSRTVIREAVRVLVSKGLIAVKHGSGMQIQSSEQWNYLDPLVLFEQLRTNYDESLLTDMLDLRRVVEIEVAVLAARRRTDDDLQILHRIVEEMSNVVQDSVAYTRLDITYHEAILAAARSRLLAQALRPVSQALQVGRLISSQRPGGPATSQQGHEEILNALEASNETLARTAMHRHILQFEDDIRTVLSSGFAGNIANIAQQLG